MRHITLADLAHMRRTLGDTILMVETPDGLKRWPGKFGQTDKWKICRKAAGVPRIRSDNSKTDTSDALSGFQGVKQRAKLSRFRG